MTIPKWNKEMKRWVIPDVKEFISNSGWKDGKFVVPETIEGSVAYILRSRADIEALLLDQVMLSARQLEAIGVYDKDR